MALAGLRSPMVIQLPKFIALVAAEGIDPLKLETELARVASEGVLGPGDLLFAHDDTEGWPLFKAWTHARRLRLVEVPRDGQALLGELSQVLIAAWDGKDREVADLIAKAHAIGMQVHILECGM